LLATPGAAASAQDSSKAPIPIGLSASLTSQFAQNGKWMRQGVELAVKEINAAGGIKGRPVKLYVEDDQGVNPTGAINAAIKLITQDQVVAIVGPHFTPDILADEPSLAQYKVPALTGATGPVVTAKGNPYVFRVRLNDNAGAKLLVRYLTQVRHWDSIGLSYVNTAFGQGGISAVKGELEAEHIKPVLVQTHMDSTKDYTSQLLAFQKAGAKNLIIWTDDQPMGLINKQIKTLGLKFGVAGNGGLTLPNVLNLAGDATNGAYSIAEFISNNPDAGIQAWDKKYKAAYGEEPELYGSVYYDAAKLVLDAIKRAKTIDGKGVRDALAATKDFKGVVTTYSAAPTGDMVHSALITRNENSKPTVVKSVSEGGQ